MIQSELFPGALKLIRNTNDVELGKLFNVIHQDLRQHRFVFNNKSSDAIHDVHLGSGGYKA